MRRPLNTILVAFSLAIASFGATPLQGQILSPGRLAEPHADLEGVRQCTQCHELGTRGISPERCLECHEPLAARVEAEQGYHATVAEQNCAECHQDHLGRDFDLLRFDPESFEHAGTGYALELSHAEADCRQCHQAELITDAQVVAFKSEHGALTRTYLGLPQACASCHVDDDPHGAQFADRACADCHDEGDWTDPTQFDHGTTAYPLTGEHSSVSCVGCHDSGLDAIYRPISYGSCANCHDDPHAGAMSGACSTCHQTRGWGFLVEGSVDERFDHTRTGFDLLGAHAVADCSACHVSGRPPRSELLHLTYVRGTERRSYPTPVAESCSSCHVDRHVVSNRDGRWVGCADCHDEAQWAPSSFGLERHATASAFPLTGAHVATPCFLCHVESDDASGSFVLGFEETTCISCHVDDDPHEGQYGDTACETCHVTEAFTSIQYTHTEIDLAGRSCRSCHDDRNPHMGQFADQDCSACHTTDEYLIPEFDHASTRFPLDGAHAPLECAACHMEESAGSASFIRYTPLGTECSDCHGGLQ